MKLSPRTNYFTYFGDLWHGFELNWNRIYNDNNNNIMTSIAPISFKNIETQYQQTRYTETMLFQRWPTIFHAAPTLKQHCFNVCWDGASQQIQNICITFIPRRPNVSDVDPTLYKCYTNVLCLLGGVLGSSSNIESTSCVSWDATLHAGCSILGSTSDLLWSPR